MNKKSLLLIIGVVNFLCISCLASSVEKSAVEILQAATCLSSADEQKPHEKDLTLFKNQYLITEDFQNINLAKEAHKKFNVTISGESLENIKFNLHNNLPINNSNNNLSPIFFETKTMGLEGAQKLIISDHPLVTKNRKK